MTSQHMGTQADTRPKVCAQPAGFLEIHQARMMSKLLYGTAMLLWQKLLCQLVVKCILLFIGFIWQRDPFTQEHSMHTPMHTGVDIIIYPLRTNITSRVQCCYTIRSNANTVKTALHFIIQRGR